MQGVFLYGPPGVGKLTVAKELQKRTGYQLYHNHLAVDLVESLFSREESGDDFYRHIAQVNLYVLEKAVKDQSKGIIMTSAYIHPDEEWYVKELVRIFGESSRDIHFVKLMCSDEVLYERVKSADRNRFGKLTDADILKSFMKAKDLTTSIPFVENVVIENTSLTPQFVAELLESYLFRRINK